MAGAYPLVRTWRTRADVPAAVAAALWRHVTWAVVDVETTGLDLDLDEMISIGVVPVVDGVINQPDSFYSLVRPRCPVTPESIKIHNLTPAALRDAPPPQLVGRNLAEQFTDTLIVAHAAWIEKAFLDKLSYLSEQNLPIPLIDTAALSRAAGVAGNDKGFEPSLEYLAQTMGLPVFTPHHALGDAITTAVVFLALAARFERRSAAGTLSVGQLLRLSDEYRL